MENNTIVTVQMTLEDNTEMTYIGGNKIVAKIINFRENPKLEIEGQVFGNTTEVNLQYGKQLNINKINTIFPAL